MLMQRLLQLNKDLQINRWKESLVREGEKNFQFNDLLRNLDSLTNLVEEDD